MEVAVACGGHVLFQGKVSVTGAMEARNETEHVYTHTQARRHNFINCIRKKMVMSMSACLYVGAAYKDAQAEATISIHFMRKK
jgi:hypothetical protein